MKHFNIKIFGDVQGVFFRDSARRKADELGIKGFAQNEPDGTVLIEAEGRGESLEKFIITEKIKVKNILKNFLKQ